MRFRHRITYFFLTLLSKWIGQLSVVMRQRLANRLAQLIYIFFPSFKKAALQNIRRAYPENSHLWHQNILKMSYKFYARAFLFLLAYPDSYHKANIQVQNSNIFSDAHAAGNGVILVSGHFGVWELLMAWFGNNSYHFVGVGVRQKNRGASKFSQDLREWSGMKHIFKGESIETMYTVLQNGDVLGLLADQDARKRGIFVNFFNIPASTPKGAARFYQQTESPLIFATVIEEQPNSYILKFSLVEAERTDSIEGITQNFTALLENEVRKHPEQYFWFHRRWKTKSIPSLNND